MSIELVRTGKNEARIVENNTLAEIVEYANNNQKKEKMLLLSNPLIPFYLNNTKKSIVEVVFDYYVVPENLLQKIAPNEKFSTTIGPELIFLNENLDEKYTNLALLKIFLEKDLNNYSGYNIGQHKKFFEHMKINNKFPDKEILEEFISRVSAEKYTIPSRLRQEVKELTRGGKSLENGLKEQKEKEEESEQKILQKMKKKYLERTVSENAFELMSDPKEVSYKIMQAAADEIANKKISAKMQDYFSILKMLHKEVTNEKITVKFPFNRLVYCTLTQRGNGRVDLVKFENPHSAKKLQDSFTKKEKNYYVWKNIMDRIEKIYKSQD